MTATPARGLFVTGTDTGVGKTWVSAALLRALQDLGVRAVGMKPVASGCRPQAGRPVNDDALLLQANSALRADYEQINPYALSQPVSPHLAARAAEVVIELETIAARFGELSVLADAVVVEGVGGWLAPLNETQYVADLAQRLRLPVVLVVGLRLGCINHALLTARAIAATGLPLAGWVANPLDPRMEAYSANVGSLAERIDAPCLGALPHGDGAPSENWLNDAKQVLANGLRQSGRLQSLLA